MKVRLLISFCALFFSASPAYAHLMGSEFGPYYDGVAHAFISPQDILALVALSLLAGLSGAQCGRILLFSLPTMWLVGMFAADMFNLPTLPNFARWVLTFAVGIVVAAARQMPSVLMFVLAAVAGLICGVANGQELASATGATLAMFGIASSIFVITALITGQVTAIKSHWASMVVRVSGSWIAAIGLLMFGWELR